MSNHLHRNHLGQGWTDRYLELDDRSRHVYVVGEKGTGKTTFLLNLFKQEALNGGGAILIDRKGDAARQALGFVFPRRFNKTIYLNPSDEGYPVGFNLLGNVAPHDQPRRVADIIEALRSLFGSGWGPRMQHILTFTLNALIAQGDATLLGISPMLLNAEYRARVLAKVRDPMTLQFWREKFPIYIQDGEQALPAILNKIDALLTFPLVRNMLGNPRNAIDWRYAINNNYLIIVNLAGLSTDACNFLGSLVITTLFSAAKDRERVPEGERKPFLMLVDDFTAYKTDLFASILDDARPYNLSVVLAHQYLKQIENETLRAAVMASGSTIAFRVIMEDAERLASGPLPGYPAEHYVNMPNFRAYCRLLQYGNPSSPFELQPLPPPELTEQDRQNALRLINHCRQKDATPREKIEPRIARFLNPRPKPKAEPHKRPRRGNHGWR